MRKLACFLLSFLLAMPLSAAWGQEEMSTEAERRAELRAKLRKAQSELPAKLRKAQPAFPVALRNAGIMLEQLHSAAERASDLAAHETAAYYLLAAEEWQVSAEVFKKTVELLPLIEGVQSVDESEQYDQMSEILAKSAEETGKLMGNVLERIAQKIESTNLVVAELEAAEGDKKMALVGLAALVSSLYWKKSARVWSVDIYGDSLHKIKAADEKVEQVTEELAVAYLAASATQNESDLKYAEQKAIAYFRATSAKWRIILSEAKAQALFGY